MHGEMTAASLAEVVCKDLVASDQLGDMLSQHKVWVQSDNGAFRTRGNSNEVILKHIKCWRPRDRLPRLPDMKAFVNNIDKYLLRRVFGDQIKGGTMLSMWIRTHAKIGKRLLALEQRKVRRHRFPVLKKPAAAKAKTRITLPKKAQAIKISIRDESEESDCEILKSELRCLGSEVVDVYPSATCHVCQQRIGDSDAVVVCGNDIRHENCIECGIADSIEHASKVAAIDPLAPARLKKERAAKLKKNQGSTSSRKQDPTREQEAQERQKRFVAIAKGMAVTGDSWRACYEPRMRRPGSWISARHGVQLRITGRKGKTFSFECDSDDDVFEARLGEALKEAESYAVSALCANDSIDLTH